MLWSRLRARQPGIPAFRRQHPIGPYVLDFYCAKARLAIEIDGVSHEVEDRPQRDARRDAWLQAEGVTVTRIAAVDVLRRVDAVADGLVRLAAAMIEARDPLPRIAGEDSPAPEFSSPGHYGDNCIFHRFGAIVLAAIASSGASMARIGRSVVPDLPHHVT